MRGNGKDAWFGWPDDPRIETVYNAWLDSDDPAEQTRLEREYQLAAFESVPFIPLGRYMLRAAWSKRYQRSAEGPGAGVLEREQGVARMSIARRRSRRHVIARRIATQQ